MSSNTSANASAKDAAVSGVAAAIIWPLRETLSRFHKSDHTLVQEKNRVFFADVYDHLVQGIEVVESLRDVLSSLQDLHISMSGKRMNEVMKVLYEADRVAQLESVTVFSWVFVVTIAAYCNFF